MRPAGVENVLVPFFVVVSVFLLWFDRVGGARCTRVIIPLSAANACLREGETETVRFFFSTLGVQERFGRCPRLGVGGLLRRNVRRGTSFRRKLMTGLTMTIIIIIRVNFEYDVKLNLDHHLGIDKFRSA